MQEETTYRALDERATLHLLRLSPADPLVRANALLDRAVVFQDAGLHDAAAALFVEAEALLAGMEA